MATLTEDVAKYIVSTDYASWKTEAVEKVKIHIYDTLLAILTGRHLVAGQRALAFHEAYGQVDGQAAHILGTGFAAPPEVAAMVNGMFAHADETDDTSEAARMHPGASIVPAAFALGECLRCSGREIVNAILTGYQVGVAFPQAVWADAHDRMHASRATHNVGQTMGAVAAAGRLLKLDVVQMRYALSYAAQLTSGVNSLYREKQHVEKAYVFGGMPAEQGVRAARLASLGFTGVDDVLDTHISFFDSFEGRSDPSILLKELFNEQAGVFQADIKLYPVGLPIQAAAQAMDEILTTNKLSPDEVSRIACHLPSQKAYIVDGRDMPPICLQYILATMVEDNGLTFKNSHDQIRLNNGRADGLMSRVELIHDHSLNPTTMGGTRNRAIVRIYLSNGVERSERVDKLRGTRFEPATWADMDRKARSITAAESSSGVAELMNVVQNFEVAKIGEPSFHRTLSLLGD